MKIKSDFVTNSSSTSFILITSGEMTQATFLRAAGLGTNSALCQPIADLHDLLQRHKEPIDDYLSRRPGKRDRIPAELLQRIEAARQSGQEVFMGDLTSEGDESENFFCQESFVIEGDSIFLDAVECVW